MTSARVELRALRREMRARRAALSPGHRIAAAQQLAERLRALPDAPASGHVAGYWAVDGEIALHAWQVSLPTGCTYCLPVLRDDGRLGFASWRAGETLVANRFGIPEPDLPASALLSPVDLALIIVPLVAFDADCHRLGMGGGWYDRSLGPLRDAARRPVLVGVGYESQRVDALAPETWDMPMDAICTESSTYLRQKSA